MKDMTSLFDLITNTIKSLPLILDIEIKGGNIFYLMKSCDNLEIGNLMNSKCKHVIKI